MRAFAGQMTTRGLNACAAGVWTEAPFYLRAYMTLRVRMYGMFGHGNL